MKNVLIILISLLISTTTSFCQVNLKNGLVACYPFNANANDESGNNNNGTINGASLTTDRFGKTNSAYKFDGNSYISIAPEQFKNADYSYSLWVILDDLPTENENNSFFSVGGPGADQNLSVLHKYFSNSNTGFNGGGYNMGNPSVSNNLTGVLPGVGRWHHLVVTRDNNLIKLFVDGVLIPNNSGNVLTNGTSAAYSNPTYAVIGSRVGLDGYFQYTKGTIDDIHIYNRPINSDEVKALYDGSSPQIVLISPNNPDPCGGETITYIADGASNTSKYQWKVDGINVGSTTSSNIFSYNLPVLSSNYQLRFSVDVTDDNDTCFPNKISFGEYNIIIRNCTPCIVSCQPFKIMKTQ